MATQTRIRTTAETIRAELEQAGISAEQVEAALKRLAPPASQRPPGTAKTVATEAQVKARPPGVYRVSDAQRLYLKKTSADAGSYFLRYRLNGKRPEMGLGSIAELTIQQARDLAGELGARISKRIDPLAERRKECKLAVERKAEEARIAAIPTVEEAVKAFLKEHAGKWRHARASVDWFNPIASYAFPVIGQLKVDVVEPAHIAEVLKAIRDKGKTSIGNKVLTALRSVFDATIALGQRDVARGNPADKGRISAIVPKSKHVTKHYRRIELDAAPVVFGSLVATARREENPVIKTAAAAWVFMMLTAARPSEALGARWDQVDFDKATWSNPAPKTRKPGNPLVVPLSCVALETLCEMRKTQAGDFVFPGTHGPTLAYSVFSTLPKKLKLDTGSPHSWRSIFRDVAEDKCDARSETAEAALSHSLGGIKGAYRRGDDFDRRKPLMQAYEDWLAGKIELP